MRSNDLDILIAGREISGRRDMELNVDCLTKSGLPISGVAEMFRVGSVSIFFDSNGSAAA